MTGMIPAIALVTTSDDVIAHLDGKRRATSVRGGTGRQLSAWDCVHRPLAFRGIAAIVADTSTRLQSS